MTPGQITTSHSHLRITVIEVGTRGEFEARLGDRLLCCSRTPLLTSARLLLEEGYLPTDEISMQRIDSTTVSMKTTIGIAAKLRVEEGAWPPKFRLWDSREARRLGDLATENEISDHGYPQGGSAIQDGGAP